MEEFSFRNGGHALDEPGKSSFGECRWALKGPSGCTFEDGGWAVDGRVDFPL